MQRWQGVCVGADFHILPEGMADPDISPLRILEDLAWRKLIQSNNATKHLLTKRLPFIVPAHNRDEKSSTRKKRLMGLFFDILLFVLPLSMFIAAISFAPWVPSLPRDFQSAFHLVNLKPGERFYDLGCGDGRTVVYAAKHFKAKRRESSLLFRSMSLLGFASGSLASSSGPILNSVICSNIPRRWDAIYVYGMPSELAGRLRKKLESECKPGTRVISYVFEIKGWEPAAMDCRMTGNPRKRCAGSVICVVG